jgi:hypothetical protein
MINIMRNAPDVQKFVDERIRAALGPASDSTIAVHVRGGNPDGGRRVVNITTYMEAVDQAAHKLSQLGKPVQRVFFCGDNSEATFAAAEYMTEHFPRAFQYSVLNYMQQAQPGESE